MSIRDLKNETITYTTENCDSFVILYKKIKGIANLLKKKYIKSIDFNLVVTYRNEE